MRVADARPASSALRAMPTHARIVYALSVDARGASARLHAPSRVVVSCAVCAPSALPGWFTHTLCGWAEVVGSIPYMAGGAGARRGARAPYGLQDARDGVGGFVTQAGARV